LVHLQQLVRHVTVDRKIAAYVVDLVGATRRDGRLRIGCSPRGSKMLLRAAQARAILQGRQFVVPDDIQSLAAPVISHRLTLRSMSGSPMDAVNLVNELLEQVEVPV
jgi:MoxR-like ATPase